MATQVWLKVKEGDKRSDSERLRSASFWGFSFQLATSDRLGLPNPLVVAVAAANQGVNPCCAAKAQLVSFGASGPVPFVTSCWNGAAFAFCS